MPYKQHTRSLWLATIVSPWVAPFAFAVWYAFGPFSPDNPNFSNNAGPFTTMFSIALIFVLPASYFATFTLGLPFVLWLRSRGILSGGPVCVGGAVAGIVTAWLYAAIAGAGMWHPLLMLLGFCLGGLCGITFCFVAGITIRPSGRSHTARST